MNQTEKIEQIRKEIEAKTGKPCVFMIDVLDIVFQTLNNENEMAAQYRVDSKFLEMLPLSPVEEWIPDIIKLENERLAWSLETFTEATPISSLRKLESEIQEIEQDIEAGIMEPMEYADALMCLFDSAGRQGIKVSDIFKAFESKLARNKTRKWIKNPDNSYSHLKPNSPNT